MINGLKCGYEDLASFICSRNPFAIRKVSGEFMEFENYAQCYRYVFNHLRKTYKRGYVAIHVLVSDLCSLRPCEVDFVVANLRHVWGEEDYRVLDYPANYAYWGDGCKDELRIILRSLHVISGTDFDEKAFQEALALVRSDVDLERIDNV